jgi:hypothetical protein
MCRWNHTCRVQDVHSVMVMMMTMMITSTTTVNVFIIVVIIISKEFGLNLFWFLVFALALIFL